MSRRAPILLCAALTLTGVARGADAEPKAAPGEERLEGDAAAKALAQIGETFKQHPCVRANILQEQYDALEPTPRQRQGVLVLDRAGRVLRRFEKPGRVLTVQRLEGSSSQEYLASQKKVIEKDFRQAPQALALLRAALTLDLDILQRYFTLAVYREPAAGQAPAQWRLVLKPKAEFRKPLPYRYIQARVAEGAPFYREIQRVPDSGFDDRVVETYSDLRVEKELTARDFADPLLDQGPKETELVKELQEAGAP